MADAAPAPARRGFRSLPRGVRWTSYAAVLLVLVLVAVLVAAVVVVRRPFPQTQGRASLPGLDADVTVIRDGHGIAQLYGDSVADLMRAQGYVSAQDRFFQMDVERHATSGRLAELVGPSGLANDELVRTLGWRRIAEQELGLADPATRQALEAYSEGVNAYLDQRSPAQLSLEYAVLGAGGLDYHPEDWSPVDSLTWLKAFAWDLHGNTTDEVDRALATASVGPAMTAELYPAQPADVTPIVDQGAVVDGVFEQDATSGGTRDPKRPPFEPAATGTLRRLAHTLRAAPAWLGRGDGVGSNSWVVDGAHSATGEPLLADDPHLGLGLPGPWEQVGLHCRIVSSSCPLDVSGVAFAGVPGVVIGHNDHISWGLTDLQADTADLFLERMRGTGTDAEALDGDTWERVRSRTETIRVEGAADVSIVVRSTRHGPLLSDVSGDAAAAGGGMGVALEWTGLQPGTTADAILGLDLATDWAGVRAAASQVGSPTLSLVYADTAGHIGYQAVGRVPIRKSGNDGRMPADGWLPQDDWTTEGVPFAGLPNVVDPTDGFVVAANQATAPSDYPYALGADGDRGYRADRIRDLIGQHEKLSVDDMSAIQLDSVNPMAATLVPYLLEAHLPAGYDSDGQRLLRDWDFTQPASGPNSAAAAYFDVVWSELLAHTFHDELPRELWPDGGQRWYAVVARLLPEPDSTWWDDLATDGTTERRDDVVREAMIAARDDLTEREGLDPRSWSWGRLHTVDLRSPAVVGGSHDTLSDLVDRDGWRVGGGSGAVDATSWDAARGYAVTTAPSMRMVVSVADWDDSRWIDLTGASGHVFDGDYTDQTRLWADGRTLAWPFSTDAVRSAGRHTLTLVPGD